MVGLFCEKAISKNQEMRFEYGFDTSRLLSRAWQVRECKFKNAKARKFRDSFADAFPSSIYDRFDVEEAKQQRSVEEAALKSGKARCDGKYKMILFSLVRYLAAKSLEILLSKYFKH